MSAHDFAEGSHSAHRVATAPPGTRRWLLNRLRCMTPAEMGHRVLRLVSINAERAGLLGASPPPVPNLATVAECWIHADAQVDVACHLAAADRILGGRHDIFALHDLNLGSPPEWNSDPKTGIAAPLEFGKTLDYRDQGRVGNIKYLWELNRHGHVAVLAQAYSLSGEQRYVDAVAAHLESWLDACPHRMGPNWSSALEAGMRLINWSVAWQLLGAPHAPYFKSGPGLRLRDRWLDSVYQHAQFIHGFFSRYSSANNHLIGEAAALFIATHTWPHWQRMDVWRTDAKAILEKQAFLQNAADGVNREQAVSYQKFVLELLVLSLMAGRANGQWFSVVFESRVEAMLDYLASIMDAGGNVPMIGDADDAVTMGLSGNESPYRSLLSLGAVLFRRGEFKEKAGRLFDKARWLLGSDGDIVFEQLSASRAGLPIRRAFPVGGYYVLGCEFETQEEIRAIVDAGPLGYEAIAAHGHADALAFTLSVGGLEFLIDPGTYAYHTQGSWRSYFRGTAAHNTVCIDHEDQSEPGGNFMWLRKARAGCSLWSTDVERDMFEGWHDGYMRLDDPVMHRRRIELDKQQRRLLIEDRLEMRGEHHVSLLFHCSDGCRVERLPGGFLLERGGRGLLLRMPLVEGASSRVVCGSMTPIQGWISRHFDDKRPAPTIEWTAKLRGTMVLRTEIDC